MTSHICIYSGICYVYMIWYDMIWYDMIWYDVSTCNTCMDDAITRQPHVELCSQHGTSRIMQLSKWTEQRKNKSQNHKKKCTTPTCCSILYTWNKENTPNHILLHTHKRKNGQQRIRKQLHSETAKKLQVKVVFLPSGKVATMKRGVFGDDSWRQRREKLTPKMVVVIQ